MSFVEANWIHLIAALWFVICWGGYTRYATWKARDTACLASVLHLYREDWMRRMLLRDNRIADASVIGNLERNASFFAFASLAPKIAANLKVEPVLLLLPMELTSGFGRCLSPITAAIVAMAGIADVSPFQVAKRVAIPVILGLITHIITLFVLFL